MLVSQISPKSRVNCLTGVPNPWTCESNSQFFSPVPGKNYSGLLSPIPYKPVGKNFATPILK